MSRTTYVDPPLVGHAEDEGPRAEPVAPRRLVLHDELGVDEAAEQPLHSTLGYPGPRSDLADRQVGLGRAELVEYLDRAAE